MENEDGIPAKVKIINPQNGGGNCVKMWRLNNECNSVSNLKSELGQAFAVYVEGCEFDIGCISPGHGMKGKLKLFTDDANIAKMYAEDYKKKYFLLWMRCLKTRKRRLSDSTTPNHSKPKRSGSVYESTVQKMHEVDVIAEVLGDKHKGTYSPEQIRCWANMIQIKNHTSYDTPPKKPFFTTRAKGATGVSPSKKVGLRSECIQQLDKWHDLLVRGVVTQEQYQEFKETIMNDLKRF